jgi:hypothetical protein
VLTQGSNCTVIRVHLIIRDREFEFTRRIQNRLTQGSNYTIIRVYLIIRDREFEFTRRIQNRLKYTNPGLQLHRYQSAFNY